ncbi:MAG: hypothetical protein JST38_16005 [Bacteroidetes bacterium]|nr:hypothetical protein [Bacteroidota bacterium]
MNLSYGNASILFAVLRDRLLPLLMNGQVVVGSEDQTIGHLRDYATVPKGRSDASADRVRPKLAEAQALAKEDDGNAGPPSRSATAENLAMAAEPAGKYGKKKG